MIMHQVLDCIDAGTEYCPCFLAETGDCIMCSQLQGREFCDCQNWKGVCIYQEYVWNGSKIKEQRKDHLCRIISKRQITEGVVLCRIKVSTTLARELNQPGAYVFLRNVNEPGYFDTPMSVMAADGREGTIDIVIHTKGTKTKALVFNSGEFYLRGPYWNGILGLKYIKGLRNSRVLLIARGVGQSPVVNVARKLLAAGNEAIIILDKGRLGINIAEEYLREMPCEIVNKQVLDLNSLEIPKDTVEYIQEVAAKRQISLIYSGGTEKLHEGIVKIIDSLEGNIMFACSNNAKFCCGEGICGSCQIRLQDGSRIRTCKTQINPREIFRGR